ncbi:hypothetical protein ACT2FY_24240 [Paraburkholderia fungorum]|uniref:hypothetical protein n=1 Tax=Paraburkholderia fungorum TaxID=134537 RepID=UPI00402B67A5
MTRTEDPHPLDVTARPSEYQWPVELAEALRAIEMPSGKSFTTVLEARRSARAVQRAPLPVILNMLAFATTPRFIKDGDLLRRTRRPSLSAGALHPLSVLLMPGEEDLRLLRVNVDDAVLEHISFPAGELVTVIERSRELLPEARGSLVALIADVSRPAAAYERFASLVWRDAGALLQTLALCSQAYGLAFCPLGLLGNEIVDALPDRANLVAVGMAVVGIATNE